MLLAEALHNHRGALLASFRTEYQMPLVGHGLSLTDFADLVAWLPRGCQLWKSMGGPAAWSDETEMLSMVEYHLRVASWQQTKNGQSGRNRPEPIKHPPYAFEARAESDIALARAEKWRRRQNKT